MRSAERIPGPEIMTSLQDTDAQRAATRYAHGSAGIADSLLDLTDATGDDRFAQLAAGVGRRLKRLAVPALDDGSGLEWPTTEGGPPIGPMWCHGSTGIGRFLLHIAAMDLMPDALELARRAGRNVAGLGGRALGPVQFHGLAGASSFCSTHNASAHLNRCKTRCCSRVA